MEVKSRSLIQLEMEHSHAEENEDENNKVDAEEKFTTDAHEIPGEKGEK